MPNFGLVQTYDFTKHFPIVLATNQNKRDYCDRHKYSFIDYVNITEQRHKWSSWVKLYALYKAMFDYPFIDWFLWCDVDNLIMNDVDLTDLVSQNKHIVCAQYKNLWKSKFDTFTSNDYNILTSCFMIKNSNISKNLLAKIYLDSRFVSSQFDQFQTAEELAIGLYLSTYPKLQEHFHIVPLSVFTSVDEKQIEFTNKLGFEQYKDHFIVSTYNYNFGSYLSEKDKVEILTKYAKNSCSTSV